MKYTIFSLAFMGALFIAAPADAALGDPTPTPSTTPSFVSGVKFEDVNGNGFRDFDPETLEYTEPTIQGWKIRIKDLASNEVTTTLTDEFGAYLFGDLTPGTYRVSEKQEAGWTQTFPISGNGKYTVTLGENEAYIDLDFGNFQNADIYGLKYEDMNGNGSIDEGEPTLPGWEITITGPLGSTSTTTDEAGAYVFKDLGPGDYTISETMQPGWGQSQPGPNDGYEYVLTPESGNVFSGVDFGNYLFVTIKGRVYKDNNFNGVRNAGDRYLRGWTINLINLQTGEFLTDTTNRRGRYTFTDLAPGTYIVQEILQPGWLPINPGSTIHRVIVVSDEVLSKLNFGVNTIQNYIVRPFPLVPVTLPPAELSTFETNTETPVELPEATVVKDETPEELGDQAPPFVPEEPSLSIQTIGARIVTQIQVRTSGVNTNASDLTQEVQETVVEAAGTVGERLRHRSR